METRESSSCGGSASEFNTETHTEPLEESKDVMRVRMIKRETGRLKGWRRTTKKKWVSEREGQSGLKQNENIKTKEKACVCMLPRRLEEKVKMVYYGEDQGQWFLSPRRGVYTNTNTYTHSHKPVNKATFHRSRRHYCKSVTACAINHTLHRQGYRIAVAGTELT